MGASLLLAEAIVSVFEAWNKEIPDFRPPQEIVCCFEIN